MKTIKTEIVNIPILGSSPENRMIEGTLYGSSPTAIIFSNMDTNDQSEWNPLLEGFAKDGHMLLTYDYFEQMNDQSKVLESAISVVRDVGAKEVVLIGASRGGVASIKVASRKRMDHGIVGVVAFSAPIEYDGTVFYSNDELQGIEIPKLLVNSENDDGAGDNRKMFEIFNDPKELVFYPGDAHGTELFDKERGSIIKKLQEFTGSVFGGWGIR